MPPPPSGDLDCADITGADIDYVPDATGGDPELEAATRALWGVRWTDDVELADGQSRVIRDGRTIFVGRWWTSASGGWLLYQYEACIDAAVRHGPPHGLWRGAIAEVVVDGGVRVRSLPTVGQRSIRLEPLLARGDELLIVGGPVAADGYEWYQGQSLLMGRGGVRDPLVTGDRGPFGWVARASRSGEGWIDDLAETRCPALPDEANRLGVVPEDRLLHCFGASELTVELDANVYCRPSELSGEYVPAWLLGQRCGVLSGDACGSCDIPVAAHPDAGVALPFEQAGHWQMSGHFDDPAAATCRQERPAAGSASADPDLVVHECRTIFVLTSLTRLGDQSG